MKFKNIKVGDTVYIKKGVRDGFAAAKYFWVSMQVERVTPKQFIVNGERYNKENGDLRGNCVEKVYFLGENSGYGKVSDETEAMNDFIKKIKMVSAIKETASEFMHIKAEHPKLRRFMNF